MVNHLFYVEKLKLFARNDDGLVGMFANLKQFNFDFDKWDKATSVRVKLKQLSSIKLDIDATMNELDPLKKKLLSNREINE